MKYFMVVMGLPSLISRAQFPRLSSWRYLRADSAARHRKYCPPTWLWRIWVDRCTSQGAQGFSPWACFDQSRKPAPRRATLRK